MDPNGRASVYPDNKKTNKQKIVRTFHSLEIKVRTSRPGKLLNGYEHLFCNYEDLSSNPSTLVPGKNQGMVLSLVTPALW